MTKTSFGVINAITLYRLLATPLLLIALFTDHLNIFKWGLLISFCTDAVDGILARYFKVVSAFGSKLDSIGDDLTVAAGIIGLIVVDRNFVLEQDTYIVILLFLFITQMILALTRYGKTTSFHTWLAKIAAVLQAVFLLAFFFNGPVYWLFYVAAGITALDLLEEIMMILMLKKYHTDVKGLYHALKLRP